MTNNFGTLECASCRKPINLTEPFDGLDQVCDGCCTPPENVYDILRYSDEPCQFLTDNQVHEIVTKHPISFLSHIYMGIESIAFNNTVEICPGKIIFSDSNHDGDFRLMPCVLDFGNGTIKKTVKVVGTNHKQTVIKDKITVGKAFVIHPDDNYVTHIIDACAMSSARTGALAAIAVEQLTSKYDKVSIVGAGRVGFYSAFYLCSLFENLNMKIKELRISDIKKDRADRIVKYLDEKFTDTNFVASDDVSDVDIVILATDSKTPILSPDMTRATTIISVGADEINHRELTDLWTDVADIYVESFDSLRYGDLNAWINIKPLDIVYELKNLLRRGIPFETKERNVFISTGSGIFDNLALDYIINEK